MEEKRRGPGRPRPAGRPKGALNKKTAALHDLVEQMGLSADPLRYLLAIVACDGAVQVPVIDPETGKPQKDKNGKPVMEWRAISTAQRIAAAKELLPYFAPKLQAVQINGKDDGPVQVATLDITQLLADPQMAETAQRMALLLAEQQADPEQSRHALPADFNRCA